MCGVAGWLGVMPDSEVHAMRLVRSLKHRGPDAHGSRVWPAAGLIHTRLSVIDLSSAGAQPMANEDGTIWTIFNGEIYNHREIRRDLEIHGHGFKGRSDTEILPHLYEEEGLEFVNKLRGMFAVAIYDSRKHTLVLARDRFGIKPLFYAPSRQRLAFASEINALLTLPGIDSRPDRQAIYDFAALFYIPAPETFYSGIRCVEPGQMLVAHLKGQQLSWKLSSFHKFSINPNPRLSFSESVDRADDLIRTAVQRQLESDVPLGSLLSGGIDSSLVSAAAQEGVRGMLNTFNVQFPDEQYDETWAARLVAQHIASRHMTLKMDGTQGTWDYVTKLLLHAGQPFADPSLFAVHALSKLMRQHVTVALSGDGGDEGFGGYNFYSWIGRIIRWQSLPASIWRGASVALQPLARFNLVPNRLPRQLGDLAGADDTGILENIFCSVRQSEHKRLCLDTQLQPLRRLFEPRWDCRLPPRCSRLEYLSGRATEINVRLSLPNDYLFKVDTASMKEGLEVRVPMLDEDLFDFALSLQHFFKVSDGTCKRVLRGVAERRLPRTVAKKSKWGFAVPVDVWVNSDFKLQVQETLLGHSSCLPEYFRVEAYKPLVKAFCAGRVLPGISREGLYRRVIMLLAVQLRLQSRFDSIPNPWSPFAETKTNVERLQVPSASG